MCTCKGHSVFQEVEEVAAERVETQAFDGGQSVSLWHCLLVVGIHCIASLFCVCEANLNVG